MKKTTNKIVLIGTGAVGTSFIYSAMAQGIAEEYGLIDINQEVAYGNELDFEDAIPSYPNTKVVAGSYELVKDADLLVITAGRPQKPGETRLEMVADNAKIMQKIAESVKANGFSGVTLIASNPVDVMTNVYQKVTGFEASKVISSSCTLDTNRLRIATSKLLDVNPNDLNMFVLGEHGDSSVSTFEHATLRGISIKELAAKKDNCSFDEAECKAIHESVWKKAYEIINRKRATFYGIGAALAEVSKAILRDERKVFAVGKLLDGEYGEQGVYAGVPCIVGRKGIISSMEFPLSDAELAQFKKSVSVLKESNKTALEAIA